MLGLFSIAGLAAALSFAAAASDGNGSRRSRGCGGCSRHNGCVDEDRGCGCGRR